MLRPDNDELGPHLLDTGPLLCLGGSPFIADLYDERFREVGQVVQVVAEEISHQASMSLAPGDPRRRAGVQRAASASAARYRHTLFAGAIPTPVNDPDEVTRIRQALNDIAERRRPGVTSHPGKNAGETYSIYEARARQMRFITNDSGAREVAGKRGVPHECFVDVADRLRWLRRDVKGKRIASELLRLERAGIDTGRVVNTALDLDRRPRAGRG